MAFLALSSHHPALIPTPPADTPSAPLGMSLSLCQLLCTSPTRPLNPKPSLSLPHTQETLPSLENLLQLEQGFGIMDNFYPNGVKEIMGCENWLHSAPLWLLPPGTEGSSLGSEVSHHTRNLQDSSSICFQRAPVCPSPCSAQAETEQMWSRGVWLLVLHRAHRSGMSSRPQGKGRKMLLEPMDGVQ